MTFTAKNVRSPPLYIPCVYINLVSLYIILVYIYIYKERARARMQTYSAKISRQSITLLMSIRGIWKGPLKILPLAGCATVPSRCR